MYAWKSVAQPWLYGAVGAIGHPDVSHQMTKTGDNASGMRGMGDVPKDDAEGPEAQPKVEAQEETQPQQQETQISSPAKAKDPDVLSQEELEDKVQKCLKARQGLTGHFFTGKRAAESTTDNKKSAKKVNYGKFNVIN